MREKTNLFMINGKPILVPDEGIGFSYEDLDDSTTGRDEGGFMHRFVLRYKVGKWSFSYSSLTEDEKNYMESLFPQAATFAFTHPAKNDSKATETTTCYRSKVGLDWYNARSGIWKNYKFNVIEC